MKFGVSVYNWEPFSYQPKIYQEIVLEAESLGYDSFFTTDHFLRPHAHEGLRVKQNATIEAWTLLAHLAAKTKTIKLGTCITPIPLRKPTLLAKMVATVDILSEGRVILGAGAGWDKKEFDAYGEWHSGPDRVEMTEEGIELIRKLWTEDVVNYEGKHYKAKDVVLEPKPVQKGGPLIWIGGFHEKMLKLAARVGDAWIPGRVLGASIQEYEKSVPKIRAEIETLRRQRPLIFGLMGWFVEPNSSIELPYIGTIDKAAETLQTYKDLGCQYVSVLFYPISKFSQMMRSFSKDIVPSFS